MKIVSKDVLARSVPDMWLKAEYRTPQSEVKRFGPALLLHGGGSASKERSLEVSELLAQKNWSSVAFDHIGHGATGGYLDSQSLLSRRADAAVVSEAFDCQGLVVGFSRGGHTTLELVLEEDRFRSALLFYPAVYPDESIYARFGAEFTKQIRVEDSWRSSSLFSRLAYFTGRILIVIGSNDAIIPQDLPMILQAAVRQCDTVRVQTIQGAPHLLLPAMLSSSPDQREFEQQLDWLIRPLKTSYDKQNDL